MSNLSDRPRSARASALAEDLRSLIGKLKRRLREQANAGDLTPSQVSVLLRLEKDGPATVSNLARAEGMRPQSMGATIAALEAAGLVSGAPDPEDGRQTILSLTQACRELDQARARGAAGLAVSHHPGTAFSAGAGRARERRSSCSKRLVDD